jgi:Alpha/beta hydrolase domain
MLRAAALCLLASAALSRAAVTNVEVTGRIDLPVANYERIAGKVHFAIDPKLPANRAIVDIDLAPRDSKGLVEFTSDLVVLQPKDPAKRNGTMIIEVSNRGHTSLLHLGEGGGTNPMRTVKDFGDALLLKQGFTLAWVGWEWDLPRDPNLIGLEAPVLHGIQGPVRSQIQVNRKTTSMSLADLNLTAYVAADRESATMTVRDGIDAARIAIPRSEWHLSTDGKSVEYPKGFEPGRIYEVIYTAKDPVVAGVGMAALRDYASYERQQGEARYTIAYGMSQDGRFLRTFVHDGFNQDEHGKKAFDGIWAHIGGGGVGSFNVRFAQPSRTRWFYPTDLPPFTAEGLLEKSRREGVAPKLFLSNNSNEYWNSAGSLVHTSLDGKRDIAPPADARIYFVAGMQHVSGSTPPAGYVRYPVNDMQIHWFMNAMMIAMNDWITKGIAPPPSRYPILGRGELVDLPAWKFPKIPGVQPLEKVYRPRMLDFGPEFPSKGIISIEPPKTGRTYLTLVPQVDADGNEIAGVHLPQLRIPLGTYTAWNLRDPKIGAPDSTYVNIGSFFHFPLTKAERQKTGDPRRSIEERYRGEQDYLNKTEQAAREMVRERLLLGRDVPQVVEYARQRWQALMGTSSTR